MLASAARSSPGVVVRILVQGDFECAVGVAENVSTSATVMAAVEVVEVLLAPGIIAYRRLCVGLYSKDVSVQATCVTPNPHKSHTEVRHDRGNEVNIPSSASASASQSAWDNDPDSRWGRCTCRYLRCFSCSAAPKRPIQCSWCLASTFAPRRSPRLSSWASMSAAWMHTGSV